MLIFRLSTFQNINYEEIYFPDVVMRYLNTTSFTTLSVFLLGVYNVGAYNLSTVIYDTDPSMHGSFTCDGYPNVANNACYYSNSFFNYAGNGTSGTVPCIGVTPNIVEEYLDPSSKKPTYVPTSYCFENREAFNAMFNKTPGITALHCRDIPIAQNSYGMWEYDSDKSASKTFSPLNDLQDSIKNGTCIGDCAKAGQTRLAQGNAAYSYEWSNIDPHTGHSNLDLYNTRTGDFSSGTNPDVYDNSSWDSRPTNYSNQLFCMEIHGQFEYQNDLEFFFRADDDLWVYIDNRIAIDLGGNHMAAPAHISLNNFHGLSGRLQSGSKYDIDIFYCDRRTPNSNFRIKTNAYITQNATTSTSAKLESHPEILDEFTTAYPICYTASLGSCEIAANITATTWCKGDIPQKLSYSLETEDGLLIDNFEAETEWSVYYGGIDLREPGNPKINTSVMTDLVPGRYNLIVNSSDATHKIPFEIVKKETPTEESPCETAPACCPAVNINITINMNVVVIGDTPYIMGTDNLAQVLQTAFGDYASLINTSAHTTVNTVTDTINNSSNNNVIKDSRDGKTYKIVTIGSQRWMAENLNYSPINETTWCGSGDCETYGRLYSWYTAANTQICPDGWRVPSNEEWETLYNYVDQNNGDEAIETSLKAVIGWTNPGSNKFGFSALPAGYYWSEYRDQGTDAAWWSSSQDNYNQGYDWRLYNGANFDYLGMPKEIGFAVRCISDNQETYIVEQQPVLDTIRYIETKTYIDTVRYIQTIVDTLHFIENTVVIDTIRYVDKIQSHNSTLEPLKTPNNDYTMSLNLEKMATSNYLHLDGNRLVSNGEIRLYDLRGHLITHNSKILHLNGINAGIYMAKSGKHILRVKVNPNN
jgi:uncharacterized protein (TIGR02145 family)/fibro-slime domain-containing protein